uniref:Small EDRK-rich factor-like N-terminal domain-containing protein n=1 Tax=Pan troglodytes TaxID=9598 RepID=A0A2I3TFB5_PANTR
MARGNQRELARQKNMKKTQEISKGKRKEDSLTASQRKQRYVLTPFFFFPGYGVLLCDPDWSAVPQSRFTASSASQAQVTLPPQPSE